MAKSLTTPVTAKTIRTLAHEGTFTEFPEAARLSLFGASGDGSKVRGRLAPCAVEAFDAAGLKDAQGRVMVYAGEKSGVKDEKSVTLPLRKPNARGAMLKRPEAFPVSEVRRLAGEPENKRGRLGSDTIAKATAAVEAERGWTKPGA